MGQPRFTEDFKTDAIKQITERGHSIADVSQRLGVSTHSLSVLPTLPKFLFLVQR